MKVAVFSDVHGNLTALEAVLADIAGQNVDKVVFAGDLCLVGARPAACLQRVRAENISSIYGNTDDWILGRQQPPAFLTDLAEWTLAQLDEGQRAWLDSLPFSKSISPTANPVDDLLVVHANLVDVNQLIFPAEAEQIERYGRFRQTDTDLRPLLAGLMCKTVAYGHLHIPSIRKIDDVQLFNISSVNMPGDNDPRAKYGIFSWNGHIWDFERRFVDYAISPEIEAYRQAHPPGWEKIVPIMETQGAFPQNV